MRIADIWQAPVCSLNSIIFDLALSDTHFRSCPRVSGHYVYNIGGDFLEYTKRK
jgi:hypothetical protein